MENANNYFGSCNGSDNFYCHKPSLMLYTDGVKMMAEKAEAFWLIDLIISHQCKKEVNNERFQVWELPRLKTMFLQLMIPKATRKKVNDIRVYTKNKQHEKENKLLKSKDVLPRYYYGIEREGKRE